VWQWDRCRVPQNVILLKVIPAFIPTLCQHPRNSTTTSFTRMHFYTSLKVFDNCYMIQMLQIKRARRAYWRSIIQESPADARVTRDSTIIPRWPSAAILDIIKPQIAPFDPSIPKTLAWNQTWSGSDAPFARYSPLNYTVTLKLGFKVTQGHR